jgi:hypothetical protein
MGDLKEKPRRSEKIQVFQSSNVAGKSPINSGKIKGK